MDMYQIANIVVYGNILGGTDYRIRIKEAEEGDPFATIEGVDLAYGTWECASHPDPPTQAEIDSAVTTLNDGGYYADWDSFTLELTRQDALYARIVEISAERLDISNMSSIFLNNLRDPLVQEEPSLLQLPWNNMLGALLDPTGVPLWSNATNVEKLPWNARVLKYKMPVFMILPLDP